MRPMRHRTLAQSIDRRKFLLGAAGSMLALPMLETYAPRTARGQAVGAPKRLIMLVHPSGRGLGGYRKPDQPAKVQDAWSPLAATGPLPETGDLSPLLKNLGDVRKEIVTIDGVDNLVRHICNDEDGHASSILSCLTGLPIKPGKVPGGASFDYVAGTRLRASAAQRSALVFPAGPFGEEEFRYEEGHFWGANGTSASVLNSNPAEALLNLFGKEMAATMDPVPVAKTLADRLAARRGSILDSVAKSYDSLSKTVSATDRERLEQHATFIRALETRFAGGGPISLAQGCGRPDSKVIPDYSTDDTARGNIDGLITPYQIENMVMALACDVTRSASLHFTRGDDPTFQAEFDGPSPLGGDNDWHTWVHEASELDTPHAPALITAYGYFTRMVALLIKRLSEVKDTDGTRLLDNTLVVWVSDMGYGSVHENWNVPVVLAGLKAAFPGGQGRHLKSERRSLGDLFAQCLRMLELGDDMTYGASGTIGENLKAQGLSSPIMPQSGYSESYIKSSLNLHLGPLDL
jgi:uncharacterized protein DUF1552